MVALVAVSGMAMSTFASNNGNAAGEGAKRAFSQNSSLSEDERAERQAAFEERMAEREARRELADEAIAAEDYNAWLEAGGTEHAWAQNISEEDFPKVIEMHNLRGEIEINHERISEIMSELGIERPGKGMGCATGKAMGQCQKMKGSGGSCPYVK